MNLGEDLLFGFLAIPGFALPKRLYVQSVFTGAVLVQLLSMCVPKVVFNCHVVQHKVQRCVKGSIMTRPTRS